MQLYKGCSQDNLTVSVHAFGGGAWDEGKESGKPMRQKKAKYRKQREEKWKQESTSRVKQRK